MNKPANLVVASLLVCLVAISVGSVAATNGNQNGALDQVQLKEQLQEQQNDGNCCEAEKVCEQQQEMTQKQLQEQLQEKLQDGTCGETETDTEPAQEQTQKQFQERSLQREQFKYGCTE